MFKAMKMISETSSNNNFTFRSKNKILPIPIIYTKLRHQQGSEAMQRIPIKGYKSFSQGAAIGESSIDMLIRIKKSRGLKYMRTLEFDPYFCDFSGLKELAQALNKFKKTLVSLNLVIRRMTLKDEMERFGPYLLKLRGLTKLRIELPHTQGIVKKDLIILMERCRRCDLLKSLEVYLIGLSSLPNNYRNFGGTFERLRKLENIVYHVHAAHVPAPVTKELQRIKGTIQNKNLKSMTVKLAFKTGWSSYFDGVGTDQIFPTWFRSFSAVANPIHLSFIFDK